MGKYDEAIAEIDVQIEHLKNQISELEQGKRTFQLLQEIAIVTSMVPTSQEYRELGWQEATRRLLLERAVPMRTREILVEVQRRGLTSSASNKAGTLSSALKQRPDLFTYDPTTSTWKLKG